MRAPLSVVLTGDAGTQGITRRVSDVALAATSPGGFASVTLSFYEPITSDFLDGYDTVTVYDAQNGEVAGQGRLTDPGRSSGAGGETWQVTAIGEGPAAMTDLTVPYALIETTFDGFYQEGRTTLAGTGQVGPTPDGSVDEALVLGAAGGSVLANGIVAQMSHDRFADCGMELGGFRYTRRAGKTDAGYQVEGAVKARDGAPATATPVSTNFNTASGTIAATVVVTDFTAGIDTLRLTMRRSGGAVTVVDDTTWCAYNSLHVAAYRYDKDGAHTTPANHANAYVLASEAVADMLGRGMLPRLDGANATITASTHQFDQLSWVDGITPGGVMEELLAAESAFTWHVWEKQSTGLFRFEFVAWPSTVRYATTVADGFDSPAPQSDVYNEVNVRYKDKRGRVRIATRTQTVDSLAALGVTRAAWIDLADEVGSLNNANRAGDRFLADHAAPPNSGTLRVARPILDLVNGRMVKPWMLRPGNLIRVRGVRPHVDSLNATDRDGFTVFRVLSVRYSDADGAATLELDAYTPTEARMIARLTNERRRKN